MLNCLYCHRNPLKSVFGAGICLLITLALLAAVVQPAAADTSIPGGTINADTTWNLVGSPYIVQGSVTIASGYTLTIDPGPWSNSTA